MMEIAELRESTALKDYVGKCRRRRRTARNGELRRTEVNIKSAETLTIEVG